MNILIGKGIRILDDKYYSLLDITRGETLCKYGYYYVKNWLRTRKTMELLTGWELEHNLYFRPPVRDNLLTSGRSMSITKWVRETGAVGLCVKMGSKGGCYAVYELACEYLYWLDPYRRFKK